MTVGAATREPASGTAPTVGWGQVGVLATVLLALLVAYGVGVLLPYYANDLHLLPLAEVAGGGHDPAGLWPRGAWAAPVAAAGLAGVAFAPGVVLTAIGLGGAWLVSLHRHPAADRAALTAALLVLVCASGAALAFLLSDTGVGLEEWRLD